MKTIDNLIPFEKTSHMNKMLKEPEQVLFFDIETTGLSPKGSSIYLIGCAFYTQNGWLCRQLFADTPAQEAEILHEFCLLAKNYTSFWNFNGTTFDTPFIQAKCKKHALSAFEPAENVDMYRSIRSYKNLLHLPGCRQKQLEEYIGLYREDQFNGGELIDLYQIYSETLDEKLLQVLLLHNFEDIQGMLELSKIMAIPRLFSDHAFLIDNTQLLESRDARGMLRHEFSIQLSLAAPLPVPLACHTEHSEYGTCFLSGRDQKAILKIPAYSGELKYFYKDYKNYSYLPEEDQAVHKSVAVYVDKSRRMPATAANCYTRKTGEFLPVFKGFQSILPLFYPAHKSKQIYISPDESFLADSEQLYAYASSVLDQFS